MRITPRDVRLLRDVALSHVLSRDQLIALGYFSSLTRVNTRMKALVENGFVSVLTNPIHSQHFYTIGRAAFPYLGERIEPLVNGRKGTPRFVQHALSVTNVRIAMMKRGSIAWRFEQQARTTFDISGRTWEIRPDGLAVLPDRMIAIEADLGHVAPAKFREKLTGYDVFYRSNLPHSAWKCPHLQLLTITTGPLRAKRLVRLGASLSIDFRCTTFDELGIPSVGGWS